MDDMPCRSPKLALLVRYTWWRLKTEDVRGKTIIGMGIGSALVAVFHLTQRDLAAAVFAALFSAAGLAFLAYPAVTFARRARSATAASTPPWYR